jgi:hypothetical protein
MWLKLDSNYLKQNNKKMKTLSQKVCVVLVSIMVFAISCKKDISLDKNLPQSNSLSPKDVGLKNKLEQRALITAVVMKDKEMVQLYVQAVKAKITADKMSEEAITFKEIYEEQPAYVSSFARKFKEQFGQIYYAHQYFRANKFPIPLQPISPTKSGSSSGTGQLYNELFSDNDGTQIYFPYSENFAEKEVLHPALTYFPLQEVEDVEAYQSDDKSEDSFITFTANEQYAKYNPTFVLNLNEIGIFKGALQDTTLIRPINPSQCNRLNYNVKADLFDDHYVVSVFIPKVKLLKNFRTWLGGSNFFCMLQCFAKPNDLQVNPQPTLNPISANNRMVTRDFMIRRRYVNDWVDFGNIYNDDWKLEQYDNPMVIYSKQGWFYNSNVNTSINVTAGLRVDTVRNSTGILGYQWSSSFNAAGSATLNFNFGNQYAYRGSDYVTRRGLLANIVGDNFANGTLEFENINYTVRKVSDCLQYAFVVNECH